MSWVNGKDESEVMMASGQVVSSVAEFCQCFVHPCFYHFDFRINKRLPVIYSIQTSWCLPCLPCLPWDLESLGNIQRDSSKMAAVGAPGNLRVARLESAASPENSIKPRGLTFSMALCVKWSLSTIPFCRARHLPRHFMGAGLARINFFNFQLTMPLICFFVSRGQLPLKVLIEWFFQQIWPTKSLCLILF